MFDTTRQHQHHSPGPWTIEKRYPRMPAEILDAEGKQYVATVSPWTPHAAANAAVLAASPELLRILKLIVAEAVLVGEGGYYSVEASILNRARAAIALTVLS